MVNELLQRLPFLAGSLFLGVSLACAPSLDEGHAVSAQATADSSALAEVLKAGKLVVLTVPHQESSFTKTNLETGPMRKAGTRENFQGIDIDLMAAFADHLGVELEIRPALGPDGVPAYAHLIPTLTKGDGDIIASSFTITDERREIIDFSDPYFTVYPAVVTRFDNEMSSLADLEGTRAVALPSTSQDSHLQRAGFSENDILYVEFQLETYSSVLDGEADFTLQDSPTAERLVRQHSELKIAFPFSDQRDSYGFGVEKGSDLRGELDAFLAELRASGKLQEITRI